LPLAFLGLALGVAGVVGYFVLVLKFGAWLPGARNTALPSWLLIAAGVVLSVVAVARAGRRVTAVVLLVANLAVAGAFASLIYVSFAVPEAHGPAIGSRAADFALRDETGKVVRLADFAGQPLLLVFYRGHW
jgi:cytochrome oxidase Cu insertion factor (SCO1/SenC/PrrC family)